jgi:hypothetical protein
LAAGSIWQAGLAHFVFGLTVYSSLAFFISTVTMPLPSFSLTLILDWPVSAAGQRRGAGGWVSKRTARRGVRQR